MTVVIATDQVSDTLPVMVTVPLPFSAGRGGSAAAPVVVRRSTSVRCASTSWNKNFIYLKIQWKPNRKNVNEEIDSFKCSQPFPSLPPLKININLSYIFIRIRSFYWMQKTEGRKLKFDISWYMPWVFDNKVIKFVSCFIYFRYLFRLVRWCLLSQQSIEGLVWIDLGQLSFPHTRSPIQSESPSQSPSNGHVSDDWQCLLCVLQQI